MRGGILFFLCLMWPVWSQGEDRALLVGLDRYGDPEVSPTPGGAADARSVATTLATRFAFPAEGIRLLIDDEATSRAIVDTFQEWLIEGTHPGDRVFFLYAGHGSQLSDQNGDEADGYDETLAPYDVDPTTGEHQIRDDVIDSLIAQLSGRRAVLLFDSCHSGTLTRSLDSKPAAAPGVRYLPRPDQARKMVRRRGSAGPLFHIEATPGSDQNAFDTPGEAGRIQGIVAFSAAEPGQLAYPLEVKGDYRGALSFLFEQAVAPPGRGGLLGSLKQAQGGLTGLQQTVTIASLEAVIEQGMQRLQKSGQLEGSQRPAVEVLSEESIEDQPLWGDHRQAAAVALTHPLDGRQVGLRTVGDRVLFHRGEDIVFEISTDRPGHLYLLVFSEGQRATCIFPNPVDRANRIDPGALSIPTHGGYRLPVQEPFGRDLVVAVVADQPLPLCEKVEYAWSEIFERVELDEIHRRLRRQVRRGIGFEVPGTPPAAPPPAWQTAVVVLETVETPVVEAQ